jgi:ribosome-binding factor A
MERVSELVKREVSAIVQELNLTGCGFVTVTAAEVSPDLKDGRIYLSVIGSAEQKQRALDILERQHGHIQGELAHRIVLKYTPRLKFVLDETEARASHIEHLLDELGGDTPDE